MSLTDDLNKYMPAVAQKTTQFAFDLLEQCDHKSDLYLIALGVASEIIATQMNANLDDEQREAVDNVVAFLKSQFVVDSVPLRELKPKGELN